MLPGERDGQGQRGAAADLLAQRGAVPGEGGLLQHGAAVFDEALLGDAAAEGIVEVEPHRAVRRDGGPQPVLRVPGVLPGVRLAGEPRLLPEHGTALRIVLVADVTGARDLGAGEGPGTRGLLSGVARGPGRGGLIACRVVGIRFRPARGVHGGDPARRIEVETAGPGELVLDADQVAVRTVGVRAALEIASPAGYLQVCEASARIETVGETDRFADLADEFPAGRITLEGDRAAGCRELVEDVVLVGGDGALAVLAEDLAQFVALEAGGLTETVDTLDQSAGRVVPVPQGPVVEVDFGHDSARGKTRTRRGRRRSATAAPSRPPAASSPRRLRTLNTMR